MASVYQKRKNGIWYVSYFFNGRRIYKSLKTTDEKLARIRKQELEVNLWKGTHKEKRKMDLEAYLQEYLTTITHRRPTTNQNELYLIKKFLRSCSKKTTNGVKARDIWLFLSEYSHKAARTFNHALGAVERFFKYGIRKSYLDENPCFGMRFKRISQVLPRFFTHEEYLKIEKAAEGHRLYPMIVMARYAGLRLGELIHLEWQDFDWEQRTIQVLNKKKFGHIVKNYRVRIIPLSHELHEKLKPYIRTRGLCFRPIKSRCYSKPYTDRGRGPRYVLRKILRQADILNRKGTGWHNFRHTFASHLVQNNVPIYKVSKWLGHSSLNMTQVYAHFAPVYDVDIEKLSIGTSVSAEELLPIS